MATAQTARKRSPGVKEYLFIWEGKSKEGKPARGELRAASLATAQALLRRQGVQVTKIGQQRFKSGRRVSAKDISLFTRQLATMMKAGVPLLQAFDIVGKGHANPSVGKLLLDIKADVEAGSSLSQAFRKHPLHFDALYCSLVEAGEQAGILETLLDRLANYKEKMLALKRKIKSALFYPASILVIAFIVTAVIMIKVVPAFKEIFSSFGADLPSPTLVVIAMSDFVVDYWIPLFGSIGGGIFLFFYLYKRSEAMQITFDRWFLRAPVIGNVIRKATVARWTRTLATMFAAGVPMVEALDSVGGAAGNHVYKVATKIIQSEVTTGTNLTTAMQHSNLFDNMVIQMVAIGEESGALDSMLDKVASFLEADVDDAVAALASLMEPMIMAVLGVLIGGLVIALYLPIFKIGSVIG